MKAVGRLPMLPKKRPLGWRAAILCELGKGRRCRCRCHGEAHGRGNASGFLDVKDPHFVPEKARAAAIKRAIKKAHHVPGA